MKYENKTKLYYENPREDILSKIDFNNIESLLEVGCGNGATLKSIKSKKPNIDLWGVELMGQFALQAKRDIQNIFIGSVEDNIDNLPNSYFDSILMSDVIEHLIYPEDTLLLLKEKLKDGGIVYSSIPNVSHIKVIFNLVFRKDWKYEESGIMDYTHLRFFTPKSIRRMFENLGFDILEQKGITPSSWWKHIFFTIFSFGFLYKNRYIQIYTVARKTINKQNYEKYSA